jgi:hypothetical protein
MNKESIVEYFNQLIVKVSVSLNDLLNQTIEKKLSKH